MGVFGPVGLGQLYCDRVDGLWTGNKLGRTVTLPQVQRELWGAPFGRMPDLPYRVLWRPLLSKDRVLVPWQPQNHWSRCR